MSTEIKFTRVNERRLTALTQQLNEQGKARFDDPALQQEFETLSYNNELFLEEGERRLNNATASPLGVTRNYQNEQTSFEKAKSGLYFWTTLVGKAVPAYIDSLTGALPNRKIWHFITDQLILGGVPCCNKMGGSGDHLSQLHAQLNEQIDPDTRTAKRYQLGLVIACLTQEELDGYGMPVVEFAQKFHWQSEFGTGITYAHVPMPDTTSDVSMDVVRRAVDLIHSTITESIDDALVALDEARPVKKSKRCAYIHCKAGVGRSWMVLMCYLTTYGGRNYENAFQLVKMTRTFVNPSSAQSQFVKDFAIKFEADERAKRLMNENK